MGKVPYDPRALPYCRSCKEELTEADFAAAEKTKLPPLCPACRKDIYSKVEKCLDAYKRLFRR